EPVARSGDRATTESKEETFGRTRGTVGRPCHNGESKEETFVEPVARSGDRATTASQKRRPSSNPWHGRETVPQRREAVARSGDRATTEVVSLAVSQI